MVKYKDLLQTIISIGLIVGMVLGAISYFASAKDLQLVQLRLEQKIVGDKVLDIQKRMWQLEDRNGGNDYSKWKSESDRNEYRALMLQLNTEKKNFEKMK